MAMTHTGNGYWLLDSAGEVFSFGDAAQHYHGNAPDTATGSFVGMAGTLDLGGYWLFDSTGQIYALGNATYHGGGGTGYAGRFVSIAPTTTGGGYWLLDSAGQVYTGGDATYYGNTGVPEGCSNGLDKDQDVSGYATCIAGLNYKFVGRYLGGSDTCFQSTVLSQAEALAITEAGLFVLSEGVS